MQSKETRYLISCFNTMQPHSTLPINWESVHFIFFFPPLKSLLASCNMSSSCSCVYAKLSFSTVPSQNRLIFADKTRRVEPWFSSAETTVLTPVQALPCCRDFFTSGYWDPRGSACSLLSPPVQAPNSSSSTVSWKTQNYDAAGDWEDQE